MTTEAKQKCEPSIKRFDPVTKYIGSGEYIAEMAVDPDGEYVPFADYQKLERELKGALAKLSKHVLVPTCVCAKEGNSKICGKAFKQSDEGGDFCARSVGSEFSCGHPRACHDYSHPTNTPKPITQ